MGLEDGCVIEVCSDCAVGKVVEIAMRASVWDTQVRADFYKEVVDKLNGLINLTNGDWYERT